MGRGNNNKIGKIKKRLFPCDIILNLWKDSKIPIPFFDTKKEIKYDSKKLKWKKIVSDKEKEWLCSWKDEVTDKTKYIRVGNSSEFKKNNDLNKFEKARKLKKNIKEIRNKYLEELKNNDLEKKQLATALYLIDNYALRVGNDKEGDEGIGVTTLKIKNLTLLGDNKIKLDFLGKDSIRYLNTIIIENIVYKNIELFIKNKSNNDFIFDKINSIILNNYLKWFQDGLTAKVFRTYNASELFQIELLKIYDKYKKLFNKDVEISKNILKIIDDEIKNAN